MSFGVGDDSGYIYRAETRAATAEESAPLIEREEKIKEIKLAKNEIKDISQKISSEGEFPKRRQQPKRDKDRNARKSSKYLWWGGWFVIGDQDIWYIKNNGMDGDNWALNNIGTGGAGAMGWKIKKSKELAQKIVNLASRYDSLKDFLT